MPRITATPKETCCGCGACAAACPQACIELARDEEGFDYPRVDAARCTDCGRCRAVCPLLAPLAEQAARTAPRFLAAWHRDAAVRAASTSGGVFTALAEAVLVRQGVVYGAAFDETFRRVRHVRVDRLEGLAALRGSKYVQSALRDVLPQACRDLAQGTPVLFSGTPCQVAALRRLCAPGSGTLLTCDLVCHGVPSPGLFERYLREREERVGAATTSYAFRDKRHGWHCSRVRQTFANGAAMARGSWGDFFAQAFYHGVSLRPCCHVCRFAAPRRVADLTLGDFWGVERRHPAYDDNRGTSLVLVNTAAGEAALAACADRLFVAPCDAAHAIRHNPHLVQPAVAPAARRAFFARCAQGTLREAARVHMARGERVRRALAGAVKRGYWWLRPAWHRARREP